MRHRPTPSDEQFLAVRSLAVDYDAGARTGVHAHAWTQLVYAASGVIQVAAPGTLWIAPPGRAVLIPAHMPHELIVNGRTSLRTLYCAPDQFERAPLRTLMVGSLLHELIMRTCRDQRLDIRDAQAQAFIVLLRTEIEQARTDGLSLELPANPRAANLCGRFLSAPTAQPLSDILRECGMSRWTAERLMMAETGMSPARWLSLSRLPAGLEALSCGRSVDEAAEAADFASRAAFSRKVKQVFGLTPGELRRPRPSP